MTEHKNHSRGKDFLMGFIPSLILALIGVVFVLRGNDLDMLNVLFSLGAALFGITLITIICHRPFIGVGIITVIIAAPLLLIGSCFALFAFN